MSSPNISHPERFGFWLRFPELRAAIDLVKMTGEGETIDLTLGPEVLTLGRERNGIRCAADIPIKWDSVPWSAQPLVFQTKIALFDRLLRQDIVWTDVLISGSYPAAAIREGETDSNCLWRIKISEARRDASRPENDMGRERSPGKSTESLELRWPTRYLGTAETAVYPAVEPPALINAGRISQALRLLAQVAAPEALRKGPRASATVGNGQARLAGRAARMIVSEGLDCPPINISCKHLNDMAYLLGRMPPDTHLLAKGTGLSFVGTRARISLAPASETALDLSYLDEQPPQAEAEVQSSTISSAISKITSQAAGTDDHIRWRMKGEPEREVQLVLPVAGGDAQVTFALADKQNEAVPAIEYRFPARLLAALTPLGKAKAITLAFHPRMLMSQQVDDGMTIRTYLQTRREG